MRRLFSLFGFSIAAGVCLGTIRPASAQAVHLKQTIVLPGVIGRIDHLSQDKEGERLFVAALGNNTVEVINLKQGKVVHSIGGLDEPQGLLYVPEFNRLYVANGGDGVLRIFDATTFAALAALPFKDDADNIRYDAAEKRLYVGYGRGGIGVVDATKDALLDSIPLSGHPESFQVEKDGPRIFVNVPGSHQVTVVDRRTKKVIGKWSLGWTAANFPMAIDESKHRAFVACRTPARLLVFDTESGQVVVKLALHGDCDDVFYDSARQQLYASCGEGFIDVFTQSDADRYALKESVKSEPKARTCFFDGNRIYLAVPKRGDQPAAIQCFDVAR
jgi:DNA-binding beta-propeller fold protein YncE